MENQSRIATDTTTLDGRENGTHEVEITRVFSDPDQHPFDQIAWEKRDVCVKDINGKVLLNETDIEVPKSWSMNAATVVTGHYLHTATGEKSVRSMIDRVVQQLVLHGVQEKYFSAADGETFRAELQYLLVNQYMAFNSPVWYNVGVEESPQCSACFINSVEDSMDSILDLARTEGRLFKWGSGTGTNISVLRGAGEPLSRGGTSSGPIPFMRGYDAMAGAIKSGGKTRRAAKMVILNDNHPDILEFIQCKASEELKAHQLVEAGYPADFNVPGNAYESVGFQNANHSIRVSDTFMNTVEKGHKWTTLRVTGGQDKTYEARDLFTEMAKAAWICGDPGIQYDDTINDWHTSSKSGKINASNPCSEFMYLDDTACNLASLNLLKFWNPEKQTFDIERFKTAVTYTILAQEILVGLAGYPTPKITANSIKFRPLGLGYANLGALLMHAGFPYDSAIGRSFAGAITSLMTAAAYTASGAIALRVGPFAGYEMNREPMNTVIRRHAKASNPELPSVLFINQVWEEAKIQWQHAEDYGKTVGYRNGQVTVLAPTGTIAFLMDCDTTGVEPDLSLVKHKKLVGGSSMEIVNQSVYPALRTLGYDHDGAHFIMNYITENKTIEGAPGFHPKHLPVFDCSLRSAKGNRTIDYMGHVRMMAAVQPFISGAISKTINMPNESTIEDIKKVYMEGWKLGLKSIAVYRDGCKMSQPLNTTTAKKTEVAVTTATRIPLPVERQSLTHRFEVAGHKGYVTMGFYPDGRPGEMFVTMAKEGSTISGLMDTIATTVSIALQHGVPLKTIVNKLVHTRFEPSGFTKNPAIPTAKSLPDYIFRWIGMKFLPAEDQPTNGDNGNNHYIMPDANVQSAPPCPECGTITTPSGSCYRCDNCGGTTGCS